MTLAQARSGPADQTQVAPRVGLFGILGSGNLGNEASVEAMLIYLRKNQPAAVLEAMSAGPERVTTLFGIPARHLHWHHGHPRAGLFARLVNLSRVGIGVLLDAPLTLAWVKRQNVVIVPGAGVLESTLPVRPWQLPYSLALVSAAGRLFGTRVALVSVGADTMPGSITRWLLLSAARKAGYRSWRDHHSKAAMAEMGIDVSRDSVYADLAFALPVPTNQGEPRTTVGLGVIDYSGRVDAGPHAEAVRASYLARIIRLAELLLDGGHHVHLFGGDSADRAVVDRVESEVVRSRPELRDHLVAECVDTWEDLVKVIEPMNVVVASRFHNVLFAVSMAKPTLSIGYAAKNARLMAEMGLPEAAYAIEDFNPEAVVAAVEGLLDHRDALRSTLLDRGAEMKSRVQRQFSALSSELFTTGPA